MSVEQLQDHVLSEWRDKARGCRAELMAERRRCEYLQKECAKIRRSNARLAWAASIFALLAVGVAVAIWVVLK